MEISTNPELLDFDPVGVGVLGEDVGRLWQCADGLQVRVGAVSPGTVSGSNLHAVARSRSFGDKRYSLESSGSV